MKVLIVGGGGMLGRKLIAHISRNSSIGKNKIKSITTVDAYNGNLDVDTNVPIDAVTADITDFETCQKLVNDRPDIIYYLASVVSGEAEANFEKGYKVNLEGTRNFFEAIREVSDTYSPRVIYTSSAAVYGGPYPELIDDDFILQPNTSYGTQKAIGELLLNDYSRRGFFDGIGLRLPTICVRPGKPNAAASGVFSNIIREPLSGQQAALTVSKQTRMVFASPQSAVGFLLHAGQIDTNLLGSRRCLTMPGITATIEEEIQSLRRVAGEKVVSLIREEFDPNAQKIVDCWNFPPFKATRARELGFTCEQSFDQLVLNHIENELGGKMMGVKL